MFEWFECWAVGDPQFCQDLRLGTDLEYCTKFIETVLDEADGAATPSDPFKGPSCKRKASAHDRRQDEELATVLGKTKVMVLKFYQSSDLSQRRGQALLGMLRHPGFDMKDVHSTTIVQLLLRLELPFKECAVRTYNLWRPGDGNQGLELVNCDYLEVFREILQQFLLDPRCRHCTE